MVLRAALYAHDCGDSLNDHIRTIGNYAVEQDIHIVRVYGDVGVTPACGRPDLERLCTDVKLGAFDAVIVTDAGRFGGDRYEAARFRWRLRSAGVRLIFTDAAGTTDASEDDSAWAGLIGYYEALMERMAQKGGH